MSTPRQFMIADSYESAVALDQSICAFLRARDGSRGSQWAGVSQRADGQFGVFFAPECAAALGDNLPLLMDEVITDDKSDWSDYTPPPAPAADVL